MRIINTKFSIVVNSKMEGDLVEVGYSEGFNYTSNVLGLFFFLS